MYPQKQHFLPALLLTMVGLLLFFYQGIGQQNFAGGKTWSLGQSLQVSDFTLLADSVSGKKISKGNLAITRTGVAYAIKKTRSNNKQVEISIVATMHPKNSFLKESVLQLREEAIAYLLHHEQGHFDISEIYAREGAKLLRTTRLFKDYRQQVYSLMQSLFKQAEAWQTLYDEETRNGQDANQQRNWNEKIKDRLKSLEAYQTKKFVRRIKE